MKPYLLMLLVLGLWILPGAQAQDEVKPKKPIGLSKEHRYDEGNLPKSVRAKAGERIVVTYKINPADVEEIKCRSDSRDVTIKGEAGNGIIRIVIRSDKKCKADVEWQLDKQNGQVIGPGKLTVVFE